MQWVMIKGGSHDKTNSPYPFELNGDLVHSERVGAREERRAAPVRRLRPATPRPMISRVETTRKRSSSRKVRSEGGAKFLFELGASPSASVLNVAVHKRGESNAITTSMNLQ